MRYWDGNEWDQDSREQDDLRAFAEAWRAMPKWVVSRSLTSVGPNATLVGEDFEAAIRKVKADVDGEIEVGGPKLAASLMRLGLIDEYHLFLHPVVLGSGAPFFADVKPALRLVANDRIGGGAIRLTYVPS
jgi:dihydrofolate reductase